MWTGGLALAVSAACVWVSVRRLRRLTAVPNGVAFGEQVGRAHKPRLQQLRDSELVGVPREMLDGVLDARSLIEAMAELNHALGQLKFELSGAAEVPRSAARIALATAGVLAVVELIQWLSGARQSLVGLSVCLGAGVLGGFACAAIARTCQQRSKVQLEAWGKVGQRLASFAESEWPSP